MISLTTNNLGNETRTAKVSYNHKGKTYLKKSRYRLRTLPKNQECLRTPVLNDVRKFGLPKVHELAMPIPNI